MEVNAQLHASATLFPAETFKGRIGGFDAVVKTEICILGQNRNQTLLTSWHLQAALPRPLMLSLYVMTSLKFDFVCSTQVHAC
jgi:hypothetical protein